MQINHSDMVRALSKDGNLIKSELSGFQAELLHMAVGVAGEGGELLDCIKKHTIYQKPLDRDNVIEELGDLEFFMERIRQMLEITREEVLDGNIKKLGKRYENFVYSNAAAQTRADKDD